MNVNRSNIRTRVCPAIKPCMWLLLTASLALQCNFASQSYNHGKLVSPGEQLATVGMGRRAFHAIQHHRTEQVITDTVTGDQSLRVDTVSDTTLVEWWSACLGYQLGVLPRLPLGRGVEIGLHIEAPAQFQEYYGLALVSFNARCGLPSFFLAKHFYHHNLELGWTVGAWVDNGWYLEYAAGWETKWISPYLNARAMRVATDVIEPGLNLLDKELLKEPNPSWNARACAGTVLRLPRIPLLPDYIVPEVSVVLPNYSILRATGLGYHVGFRWHHGI